MMKMVYLMWGARRVIQMEEEKVTAVVRGATRVIQVGIVVEMEL